MSTIRSLDLFKLFPAFLLIPLFIPLAEGIFCYECGSGTGECNTVKASQLVDCSMKNIADLNPVLALYPNITYNTCRLTVTRYRHKYFEYVLRDCYYMALDEMNMCDLIRGLATCRQSECNNFYWFKCNGPNQSIGDRAVYGPPTQQGSDHYDGPVKGGNAADVKTLSPQCFIYFALMFFYDFLQHVPNS